MKAFNLVSQLLLRLRYPASLPEEIATDLGIDCSNLLTFEQFVVELTNRSNIPRHLVRFMPREEAEAAFTSAQRKERFARDSIFSYYFHEGWLEFKLYFDEQSRLRRIYLQHKHLQSDQEIEIPLKSVL